MTKVWRKASAVWWIERKFSTRRSIVDVHSRNDTFGTEDGMVETIPVTYFLKKISLVPQPASEDWVMTTEQTMMMDRALLYLEFSLTGGRGKEYATPRIRLVIENNYRKLEPLLIMKGKGGDSTGES